MSVAEAPAVRPSKPRRGAPGPTAVGTDPAPHAEWARAIARRVVRRTGLWRHREELEAEAVLVVCERAAAYRPGPLRAGSTHTEAFRGYAYRRVEARVLQALERLENAGTYHTRKYAKGRPPISAASLSALAGNGEALDLVHDGDLGDGAPALLARRAVAAPLNGGGAEDGE